MLAQHELWLKDKTSGLEANLYNADLRYANLRYANLGHANLRHANLGYADLGGADLGHTNLYRADLRNANLREANLYGAKDYSENLFFGIELCKREHERFTQKEKAFIFEFTATEPCWSEIKKKFGRPALSVFKKLKDAGWCEYYDKYNKLVKE